MPLLGKTHIVVAIAVMWSMLYILGGCAPRVVAPENTHSLSPKEVASAFAADVLERADYDEAIQWCVPELAMAVNSQIVFVAVGPRTVVLAPGNIVERQGESVVRLAVKELKVGQERYSGEYVVVVSAKEHKVVASELKLKRSDGLSINL